MNFKLFFHIPEYNNFTALLLESYTIQTLASDPDCVKGKVNHAVLLVGYNKTGPEVSLLLFIFLL